MNTAKYIGFLNTPPIWENKEFDIPQFAFPQVKLETFSPSPIPDNLRLGHQMEYVFQQLVEHSDAYEIVLQNLPISDEKRTLGEIDFILKDKTTDQLIHVELTYKFYLIDPKISDPIFSLIGPNRRDRFFDKMEKIKHHQFSLLHSEAGVKVLADHQIDHLKLEHQCCFKAQLFQPYKATMVNLTSSNKSGIAGYWLRLDDFNTSEFANNTFYLPVKTEWVIEPHDQVDWKSHRETIEEINLKLLDKRAPMIWRRNDKKEFEKLFVVWW